MAVFKRFESSRQEDYSVPDKPGPSKQSLLGKTMVVKGKVRASEEMVIEGKIDGHINSNHRVVVGRSGIIKADIEASEIIIQGKVDGNVRATSKVEVFPEGILNGNIISQRVVLAEGAIFKGSIDMSVKDERKSPLATPSDKIAKEKKEDVKK